MVSKSVVSKFGGTSMADASQIEKVASIVMSDPRRNTIVVSAPGKTSEYKKVTDLLIEVANNSIKGVSPSDLSAFYHLKNRYSSLSKELGIDFPHGISFGNKLTLELETRLMQPRINHAQFVDSIKAFGEESSAKIFVAYLKSKNIDAHFVDPLETMVMSEDFGNATVDDASYMLFNKNLNALSGIRVVPGFYGKTLSGKIATFPRDGSDITGAVVANAIDASLYENWTDVDGIFRADPKIVEKPQTISYLTYDELRELSFGGASVYHKSATAPVKKRMIPINVKNTNNPTHSGTIIDYARIPSQDERIIAVTCKKDYVYVIVKKDGLNDEAGIISDISTEIKNLGKSIEHMPSGADELTVIMPMSQLPGGEINSIIRAIKQKINPDSIEYVTNQSLISAVGLGMRNHVDVEATITNALAKSGIHITTTNHGSRINYTVGVNSNRADESVRAIYSSFFK